MRPLREHWPDHMNEEYLASSWGGGVFTTWQYVIFMGGLPTFRSISREGTMIIRDVTLEVANRSNPRHK
jgi:hypothetical protein